MAKLSTGGAVSQITEAERSLAQKLDAFELSRPRLHFDAAGRDQLRARAASTQLRYAELLLEWVQRHHEWAPPTDLPDSALNEVVLERSGAHLTNAALAFVVSGRDEHRDLTREWALAMCELPRAELRNYGLGLYAAGLARAYDWLYEEWSAAERLRLRDHLSTLVRQVYLGSVPGEGRPHWWAGAHLHHDFWVPVGGYGEAALSLLGEVEEAGRWASRAKLLFDECFSWLGDDGAWHEGAADWCYALAPLLWFYGAWQSAVGENLHDVPWLRRTALFRLYHWLPDDTYVYLNDSFRSGRYNTSGSAACHVLRRLAGLFRDGRAQWLAERDEAFDLRPEPKGVYQAPYEGSSYRAERTEDPDPASQCLAWNLLWYDPTVEAQPLSDLPRCRHFANQDVAILRSGWDDEAAVVSLSCGPLAGHRCAGRIRAGEPRSVSNFSHAHADYNSLTLFARGRYFLVPPGYARRSSGFQNTVSVNGADLSVDPALDVRLLGLLQEPDFAYAVGDATAAFAAAPQVTRYRRHLVLLDGCLLVYDDLRLATLATRAWNRFQWTLHSDPGVQRLSFAGSTATWRPQADSAPQLVLEVLEPADFAWERSTLHSQAGTAMLETLKIVRPEWYSDRMQVLAVLSWQDQALEPSVRRAEEWLGVTWPDQMALPSVGFALTPADGAQVRRLQPEEHNLGDRPLLLFG
jgi:hypothetical protein